MAKKNLNKAGKAQRKIVAAGVKLNTQTILTTTDFSGESLPAIRYAVALGATIGASVTLLHVVKSTSLISGMEAMVLARTDSQLASMARKQLKALARHEARLPGKLATMVRSGTPFHEIVLAARENAADLIVIATHGHTGVKRVLLGSTTERVVRHAPCPVLTVPTRIMPRVAGKTPPIKLKRIVVAIDFSTVSKDALPYALLLAAQYSAELLLVHIVEKFPIDILLGDEFTNQTTMPQMKQAEADLERIAEDLPKANGQKVTAVVRYGRPFEEICRTAKTAGADMIVLTTHGYTGLKHVWLGSTAERVVRSAPCPVLVVRELAHELIP